MFEYKEIGYFMGHPVGYMSQIPGGVVVSSSLWVTPSTGVPCKGILVDKTWAKAPALVERFCLLHEVGHIVHGDLDQPAEVLVAEKSRRREGTVLDMELAADQFAIEHCTSQEIRATAAYFWGISLWSLIFKGFNERKK